MTDHRIRLCWASLADFHGCFDDLETALPEDERERARRFIVNAAARRFVIARTLLRRTLAERLDAAPSALIFGIGEHGKPHLRQPKPPAVFGFNLSHSGEVVVLVTAAGEIGVDVEELRKVPAAERLARRYFSPSEREFVLAVDDADRERAFFRIWTQKEAWLKATGLGVGMRLADVETEADPAKPPRLLTISGDQEQAKRWSFAEAEIPGAVCIAAVEAATAELDVRRFTSDDIEQTA